MTFLRRHWLYLILCLLLSGVAADFAAQRFTVLKYGYEAQLLYNRIGSESLGYEPPMLTALTPIVESPVVLDEVRRELKLDSDLKTLSEAISVEVPYESSLFRIKVEWPKPDQGKAILNRTIDHFMDAVAISRNTSIGQTSGGLTSSMYEVDQKLKSVREQMHDFNNRHKVLDLERDLITLRTEVELLEKSLGTAQQRHDGRHAQLDSLIESLTGSTATGGEAAASHAAAAKKSQDLQRWQVLRDLVGTEERRIEEQATLEFQEKEFERAKKLHEKQLISDAEFDAAESKLKILQSKQHPSLENLHTQLEMAQNSVPSLLKNGGVLASAGATPEATHRIDVELSIIAGEWELKYLQAELDQNRQRMTELIDARIESQSLEAELTALTHEKARLQERQSDLQTVRGAKPIEFSVVQAAAPSIEPVKSNRKKLLIAVFGGCMVLLVGPVLLLSTRTSRPVLGTGSPA